MPDDTTTMRSGQPCQGLTRRECADWLVHDPDGQAWFQRRGGSMRSAIEALFELSARSAAKINARRAANNEDPMNTEAILKNARRLGEHGVFALIQKHADSVKRPGETSAQAFTRVFLEDSAEGKALRNLHQIAKGDDGPLSPAQYDDADAEITDDANDEALALLERLADKLRQRSPGMTKAAAFTAIYTDPQYAPLAKAERTSAMRKIGVAV
jgi:hypothetical protein